MFHMYRTEHKTQYRHPLTSTSTQICILCKRPWTLIKILVKNKYINLQDLLKSKGYISGQQQTNLFISSTVDHKRYGQLRTNSRITSPRNTKPRKKYVVRQLVYKTSFHSPADSSTVQTSNVGKISIKKTTLSIQQVIPLVNMYSTMYTKQISRHCSQNQKCGTSIKIKCDIVST